MALVSVVIPVFNAATFIRRAVSSVLAQTFTDFEIIIVDDCSRDNTVEIVEALAREDGRIKLFVQDVNGGPSAARNRGFKEARGEWIALLDADDAFMPNRLEAMLKVAVTEQVDMLADNLLMYDLAADTVGGQAFPWDKQLEALDFTALLSRDQIGESAPLGWIKPLFRKAFLEQTGLVYREDMRHAEDFYFYSEILLHGGRAALLNAPLYIYTTRVGFISGKVSEHSRTVSDFKGIAASCDRLVRDYAAQINDEQRRLLKARKWSCLSYGGFLDIKHALQNRQFAKAVLLMMMKPAGTLMLVKRMLPAVSRRLAKLSGK